ncbi:uncharacterized protein LOC117243137 [Bombus vosnesenskii]|uniref:Uncharacterized protein LOC117243137 n=1 Tax=Bombus vosnesenskii TaxID=207650 RepID=A0A6J3LNG9_9HYME|nr:uncharacterized protein LOC117243137 [Bombus vosnesenskii]
MTQRRTVPRRVPEGGGSDPVDSSPKRKVRRLFKNRMWLCQPSASAALTMLILGSVNGWTTISLAYLISGTGGVPLTLTHSESSWIVSSTVLGSMIGSLVAVQLAGSSCRKNCLVLCNTMFTLGWFTIYAATSVPMLYLARGILGIGIGIARTVNPGVADINIGSTLSSLSVVNVSIGTLVTSALGLWLMYESLLQILAIISFISFLSNTYFPETLFCSVATGQTKQGCKSIAYYQSLINTHKLKMELHALRTQTTYELHRSSSSEIHQPSTSQTHQSSSSEIYQPSTSKISPDHTCEIRQPSTSQIHRPTISEIHQPSTSQTHQSSSSEIHQPPTSQMHRSSSSEINTDLTCEIRQPSTSQIHRPPTSEIHQPSTSQSDLCTQSNEDLREWADTDETHIDLTKYNWSTKLQAILQRSNRKALFIMLGLIMAQHLSGNYITTQYLLVLFGKTTISIRASAMTILVMTVGLICGTLCTLTVTSLERRTLLILSTLGSCFTLIILATYLLLVQYKSDVSILSPLPVINLIIYQVMFHIGLGTLPNVLQCELFPTELKGFVGAIIVIFDGIIGFTVPKLYQMITDNVGSYAIYFIFATSCWVAFVMVFIWVPETKGKTYHEVEALLVGKNLNSPNEEVRTAEMDIRRI